jgi:hypothetical protein
MSNIAEIILADGEVISISDFASENEFQLKLLNSLDFESIRSFFIKKTIVETVKEKHKLSNGSNGVSTIELLNLFKWNDLETYLNELEEKKIIQKRQGVNLEMYFVYKK